MRRLHEPHQSRHADTRTRVDGTVEGHRAAIAQESIGLRRGRGPLASVVGGEAARARVVMEQERATAEARRLWLHQPEHELRRNGRVDRRPTCAQDVAAGGCRVRVRGRDHVAGGGGEKFGRGAGRGFRGNRAALGVRCGMGR